MQDRHEGRLPVPKITKPTFLAPAESLEDARTLRDRFQQRMEALDLTPRLTIGPPPQGWAEEWGVWYEPQEGDDVARDS